jgi:hypothetical protein
MLEPLSPPLHAESTKEIVTVMRTLKPWPAVRRSMIGLLCSVAGALSPLNTTLLNPHARGCVPDKDEEDQVIYRNR